MNNITLLFLDDDPERIPMLPRNVDLHYVRTLDEFKQWLATNGTPDIISFDHDLAMEHYCIGYTAEEYGKFGNTGYDCALWAVQHGFIPSRVIVHTWNPSGAKRILSALEGCNHGVRVTVKPFNPRKPHLWDE